MNTENLSNNISVYFSENNLPYFILGIPECKRFDLLLDSCLQKVYQNSIPLKVLNNSNTNSSNYISI